MHLQPRLLPLRKDGDARSPNGWTINSTDSLAGRQICRRLTPNIENRCRDSGHPSALPTEKSQRELPHRLPPLYSTLMSTNQSSKLLRGISRPHHHAALVTVDARPPKLPGHTKSAGRGQRAESFVDQYREVINQILCRRWHLKASVGVEGTDE
jgi:hypothetical protein